MNGCKNTISTCTRFAKPMLEIQLNKIYNKPLNQYGWKYDHICQTELPKQEKLSYLQHFHIPKTSGTALTSWLFDYMNCNITRPVNKSSSSNSNIELNPCVDNSITMVCICVYMYLFWLI
mgnify:FL=1